MEADPTNVVMCPYTIVVYATAGQPKQVFVAYRCSLRPDSSPASQASQASQATLRELDALLDGLAREAVGRK